MQSLEVSSAVRPIYGSLGAKRLISYCVMIQCISRREITAVRWKNHMEHRRNFCGQNAVDLKLLKPSGFFTYDQV